ncbi:recombinase family protein [Streptomyces sp. NPDC056670]|uniref:recombinase family protein n=1 Tax=Streptomyces sp. NPDC056670 TaxID=3345904 RepID=UPI0036C995E6
MGQVRLLGALRESKKREWSDSFEGQELDAKTAARRVDDSVLVGWSRDRDVSGREVRLFKRPELKKWLDTPERFDGFALQSMSRLTRRPADIYLFFEWCDEHGKFFVTFKEGIDTRTEGGRRMAEMYAMTSSWEWEEIQYRNKASIDRAREAGRWHGGTVPYGYAVAGSKGHWRLVPATQPIVCTVVDRREWSPVDVILQMIDWFLSGWSYLRIAEWLDWNGIPTSTGKGRWTHRTVKLMLKSRSNLLGEDGHGNERANPLVPISVFQQVQREMKRRGEGVRKPPRKNANPLSQAITCIHCQKWMHYLPQPAYADGTPHLGRFNCTTVNCPGKTVPAKDVWEVADAYMRLMGKPVERHTLTVVPGVDHTDAIEDLKARMGRLRRQDEDGDWDDDRDGYKRRMGDLRGKLRELEAHPVVPDREEWEPTGETYLTYWQRCTLHEKGAELRRIGARVLVDTTKPKGIATGRLRMDSPSQWLSWGLLGRSKAF